MAGELSRRGYVASVTLRNTEGIDILASDGAKAVNIQVKTCRRDQSDGWDFGSKPLEQKAIWETTFYVLVEISSIHEESEVNYFIFPKNELNRRLEIVFQDWRNGLQKNGKARTSNRRRFKVREQTNYWRNKKEDFDMSRYQNSWVNLFA